MKTLIRFVVLATLLLAGPAEAGRRRIAAAQEAHATFTVGTARAKRGEKAYGVMHVPAGVDPGYDIPVAVVHGARPGPVLAVVSGAHGSEYASILAVQALIDAPSMTPAELSGTLILVPLVNVPSFERVTPHVNPTDNKSMNSRYPGDLAGTQTDRASYVITKEVVDQCDHLIDLHGGDLDENLRPYSYWTVTGNAKQDEFSRGMILAFGLDHIIISRERPKDPKASRFLENTASTRGKPSFTAEAGRSGPVDAGDVTILTNGVLNVMGYLKMTRRDAKPVAKPVWVEVTTVASEYAGVFLPQVSRDAHVTKGSRIGIVRDVLNRPVAEIAAPESGIIMFIRALPSLKKGDTIASIGVVKPAPNP